MRKVLAIALAGALILATLPSAAFAGDPHAVRNRWAGFGIGVAAATLGGILLGAIQAPVYAAAPPVVYTPPPVVYAPPAVVYAPPPVVVAAPPVVYAPPAVIYARPLVVVHRGWGPPGHWRHHGRWHRD